jgi:uncharacterized Tic20 family protein
MEQTALTIPPEERTLAALTHMSGLAGYIVPFAGVLVPIVIWIVKSESRVISAVAKQAILLNVVVFLLVAATAILWLTIILIPVVLLFWFVLTIVAIALPIVGAIKASEGRYYRYPVVGIAPVVPSAPTTPATPPATI